MNVLMIVETGRICEERAREDKQTFERVSLVDYLINHEFLLWKAYNAATHQVQAGPGLRNTDIKLSQPPISRNSAAVCRDTTLLCRLKAERS